MAEVDRRNLCFVWRLIFIFRFPQFAFTRLDSDLNQFILDPFYSLENRGGEIYK